MACTCCRKQKKHTKKYDRSGDHAEIHYPRSAVDFLTDNAVKYPGASELYFLTVDRLDNDLAVVYYL